MDLTSLIGSLGDAIGGMYDYMSTVVSSPFNYFTEKEKTKQAQAQAQAQAQTSYFSFQSSLYRTVAIGIFALLGIGALVYLTKK